LDSAGSASMRHSAATSRGPDSRRREIVVVDFDFS
jgi:hypothetical protein